MMRRSRVALWFLLPLFIVLTGAGLCTVWLVPGKRVKEATVLVARHDLRSGSSLHRVEMPLSLLCSPPRRLGFVAPTAPPPPVFDEESGITSGEERYRKAYVTGFAAIWGIAATAGPASLEWLGMSCAADVTYCETFFPEDLTSNFEAKQILARHAPWDYVEVDTFPRLEGCLLKVPLAEGQVLKYGDLTRPQ
jgi:hypothetical protein